MQCLFAQFLVPLNYLYMNILCLRWSIQLCIIVDIGTNLGFLYLLSDDKIVRFIMRWQRPAFCALAFSLHSKLKNPDLLCSQHCCKMACVGCDLLASCKLNLIHQHMLDSPNLQRHFSHFSLHCRTGHHCCTTLEVWCSSGYIKMDECLYCMILLEKI